MRYLLAKVLHEEVKLLLGRAEILVEGSAARVNILVLCLPRHQGLGVDRILRREAESVEMEPRGREASSEGFEVPHADAALRVKGEEASEHERLATNEEATGARLATAGRTSTLGHWVLPV